MRRWYNKLWILGKTAIGHVPAAKTDAPLPDCAFGADFCPDCLLCSLHGMGFPGVNALFNTVCQAVTHPLDVQPDLITQGEPVHLLAEVNVSETLPLPTPPARAARDQ